MKKIFSTSQFKLYHKDFEDNWDYLISESPLFFSSIEGVLQLNYQERINILEILERKNGIAAIKIGEEVYGFEYTGETATDCYKYRLLNAHFEDISVDNLEERIIQSKKEHEKRQSKFKENMEKACKWNKGE